MPSQHSYTIDVDTQLRDTLATTTSDEAAEVAGVARVLDFGNTVNSLEQVAYIEGAIVIDVTALDFTTGDEEYNIICQLSDDADADGGGFDAGDTIVNRAVIPMGLAGGVAGSGADNDTALGRVVLHVDNEHKGVKFRFMRLFIDVTGTTPIINFSAFFCQKS